MDTNDEKNPGIQYGSSQYNKDIPNSSGYSEEKIPPKPPVNNVYIINETPSSENTVIDINNLDRNNESLMKKGAIAFFEYIIEFEEDHPWLFFIGIALVLFVIIGSISSLLFGSDIDSLINFDIFNNKSGIVEETENKEEEKIRIQESLSSLKGIDIGIQISNLEAYDNIVFKETSDIFLANEIVYIQKVDSVLIRDIQTELSLLEEAKKYEHLKNYLTELISTEKEGANLYKNLNTVLLNLDNEKIYYEKESKSSREYLDSIMWTAKKNEIGQALKKISDIELKYDEVDNKIQLAEPILNSFTKPLKVAQARIAGIRANKDLLLSGLKVIQIDEAGFNFQETGVIDEWYKSEAPINEDNAKIENYLKELESRQNSDVLFNKSYINSEYDTSPNSKPFLKQNAIDSVMRDFNIQPKDIPRL